MSLSKLGSSLASILSALRVFWSSTTRASGTRPWAADTVTAIEDRAVGGGCTRVDVACRAADAWACAVAVPVSMAAQAAASRTSTARDVRSVRQVRRPASCPHKTHEGKEITCGRRCQVRVVLASVRGSAA